MLISVVTGTVNRLESLIRMVRSVREHIPAFISYEIVLVDGGSGDGTQAWAKSQKDIALIEHGELRGAIRAFCDGAKAAKGQYVILANDDVEFQPGSILAAVTHLETHPQCGAVAFMDNRPVDGRPQGAFRAQLMPAVKDGRPTSVVYAQVGMFRCELGNKLGWWGADDPVMGKARTYGGDNWLSARIWESGYSVDVVRMASVVDNIIADGLREVNTNAHDKAYREAYPAGPSIGANPIQLDISSPHLRVLYLPIFEPGHPTHRQNKRGLREALERVAHVWEWDYLDENRGACMEDLQAFAPHLIFTQFHDPRWGKLIDQLRVLCPQAIIVNWNGDARGLVEEHYLNMLRKVDLQLVTNAAALDVYRERGIPAAYWQIGYEVRGPLPTDVPAHDVIFLGNAYSDSRRALERALRATKYDIGLYGYNWQKEDGMCLYDFGVGEALYKKCKVAIGDAFEDSKERVHAFTSNRMVEALASGAFFLQQHVDGLDEFNGTKAGTHYVEWDNTTDLIEKLDYWLDKKMAKRRKEIAAAGQKFALEHWSFDTLVRQLITELLPALEAEHEPA